MTHTHVEKASTAHAGVVANGAAMAAVLASGIGTFAMGLFVVLHEAGLYVSPSLYAPAGGLSGRTTFAVIVWLAAWAALHAGWKRRVAGPRSVLRLTLVLVILGILGTFPPVWGIL